MPASHLPTSESRRSTANKSKAARIAFRVSDEQHDLLAEASRVEDRTLSAFILDAATKRAEDVLADRRLFRLPEDQWQAFAAMLDRPVIAKPRLAALVRQATVFDDDSGR